MERTLHLRQRSQNLVEFGLSVAAVSFVALIGFRQLSLAQSVYWGGAVQSSLAQPTPAPGDFIHPTQLTGSCTPTSLIATIATTFNCAITVTDTWTTTPSTRSAPKGRVQIVIDAHPALATTCTLQPAAGNQPFSTCPAFTPSWTPQAADAGTPHTLVAQYIPDAATDLGKHAASTLTPGQSLTVVRPVTVAFVPDSSHTTACWNPYSISGFSGPNQVEVGHPAICHLLVTDGITHQPISDTPIKLSEALGLGAPPNIADYFSCYTHNKTSALPTCSNPGSPFIANTDTNGELWFVFRSYFDAWPDAFGATLTATPLAYPGNPSGVSATVSIEPPVAGPHNADMVVNCPSYVSGTPYSWSASNGQTVQSDARLSGPAGASVACTAIVFDTDQGLFAVGANPDQEDLYSPFGTVSWSDETGTPIKDQLGQAASCTLDPAKGNLVPAYKPLQYHGLPPDASGCQVTLVLSGHHSITAQFTPTLAPKRGHNAVTGRSIDADFH